VLSEKNVFKIDGALAILKSAARFCVYFDFMRFLRLENGNFCNLSKIKSLCYADSKHKKSSKYFLRKTHFKLAIFEFAAVWSGGGGAAECRYMRMHLGFFETVT
jgi:hypothetical protein